MVPLFEIDVAQTPLHEPEEDVMVPLPLFVMVPDTFRLPVNVAVALLVKLPVMLAPEEKVVLPPLFMVSPPPNVAKPPMLVVALMVTSPVTLAAPVTVIGPPLFT